MGRSPCCDKLGLKKGPWTPEEDQKLLTYIQEHGHGSWRALPPKAGLQRCGKSCRLRWTNYLRPDIKRGDFSLQEQQSIIQLHALLGNRWSAIASHLPKRTDNEIKNYWNTHLKKRLTKMGIDPTTHKPKSHAFGSGQSKDLANLSHMAQWETARLEAEARIVRESKLIYNPTYHSLLIHEAAGTAAPPPPPPTTLPLSLLIHEAAGTAAPPPPPPTTRPLCLDILKVWQGTWIEKGKKDISIINSFFAGSSKGQQLESPTSILKFSDNNMVTNIPVVNNVGLVNDNTLLADINYTETLGACTIGYEQLEDIMGNSPIKVHDIISSPTNCFPSFLESYTDVTAANGQADNVVFIEDNYKINYWSNILSAVSSPIDS